MTNIVGPQTFTTPPRPADLPCRGCQKPIPPLWVPPVWDQRPPKFKDAESTITLRLGTGRWIETSLCQECEERELETDEAARQTSLRAQYLAGMGLPARFAGASLEALRGDMPQAFLDAIHAARYHGENLYLYGSTPGTGKTHVAAALLRHHVAAEVVPGYFKVAPKLLTELRDAVRLHKDGALLDMLCRAGALVLDDLGVEKPTEYALERLYLLIDHWYSEKRKRLVITSNLSPGQIGERLDRRLASRIVGMCRVVEVKMDDYRIKQAKEALS